MQTNKPRVLFLCTGNSCRSQMAEGFLRHYYNEGLIACSAGLEPRKTLHPLAIRVMEEVGIDISGQRPKGIGEFLGRQSVNFIVTVCSNAEESCPRIWPGVAERNRLYWPFDDPAAFEGSDEERIAVFRSVRDQIQKKIKAWIANFE